MNEEKFWQLMGRAIEASGNDPDEKLGCLEKEIQGLPLEEIAEYARLFDQKEVDAYRWDLWAAAYIINGGCSDDAFMDFRACLICAGKTVYEDALKNPDSLADLTFEDPEEVLFFEGYQYVPMEVYEAKAGRDLPDTGVDYPADPAGQPWDEDSEEDLRRLCPRLFEKYW